MRKKMKYTKINELKIELEELQQSYERYKQVVQYLA